MKKLFLSLFAGILFSGILMAAEDVRLLRFPAVHGNQVVFTYAGDLYTVPLKGGLARRLTSDEKGYEMFARFSPDGKHIAFTGQYDGNTEVFLIPAEGGSPKRLTYTATLGRDDVSDRMGPNNIVMTWRNNNEIVYRSRKQSFNSFKGQLFQVSSEGGMSKELPLPSGGWCSFSPDGKKMAFNRIFREFRTWKYYKGGMADDIWIYDFETKETTKITDNINQDIFPMWHGDKIYYLSDRDRTMNLFVYDTKTKETKKVTDYTEYDIKFPSLGDHSIVYENGGYLYNYELSTGEITKIPVIIDNDLLTGRDRFVDASKFIDSYAVSPAGERVVFGARGDVFTVPAKSGITRNLTKSPGVHDRNVEWSPDGKYISFISDRTGEDEIYIQVQNGSEPAVQLTSNSDTYKYNPVWSPDSKKLMWSDKKNRLNYIDIATKEVKVVATTKAWEIHDYSWSPDSRWIAYTMPHENTVSVIYIYDTQTGESHQVTDNWYEASNPVFDTNGKYLFFTSARDFNPIYSWVEWNYAYRDMLSVYFVTLQKSTPSPFAPENDEVKIEKKESQKADTEKSSKSKNKKGEETKEQKPKAPPVKIDFDGIAGRIIKLPIAAGSYWGLAAIDNNVYYLFNSASSGGVKFKMFDLKDKKEKDLGKVRSFIVTANNKKMLVNTGGKYAVIDLPKSPVKPDKYLDLSNMKVWVDYEKEWTQIFNEAWRQMRDFLYAPNMQGQDWPKIREKYEVLLPYVKNRNDLNYVIGEMIGEISIGHAYISGGDKPKPERIKTGLLGAKISKDESGYFRIDEILPGENWVKKTRSPLTEVGVNVKEGDYILAVNETSTKGVDDIYKLLLGTAGKQVILKVNSQPSESGAHNETVIPIDDESGLYYYKWVKENTEKVNKATNGQVGYIHIPDMGPDGLNEFVKHFYPQLNKKALIIDDRGNGGGNVSPMIIERLLRKVSMYAIARNNTELATRPAQMMRGPKVLLVDQYSASDGDLFAYQFKKYKIGKVIGRRTWGGVVGIRGPLPFIDGGDLRKPEFAHLSTDGKWIIEGHGVDPDVVVDNDPAKEYEGIDQQLNKAIEVILDELKDYKEPPAIPPYPDKTK
ncbi:MAG: protease [Chlorobi bacterium]|nr:protease [Chlorobiota bacterium]